MITFTLVGLLCQDPTKSDTCTTKIWAEEGYFKNEADCIRMGVMQLALPTPYGYVTNFECRPSGEAA